MFSKVKPLFCILRSKLSSGNPRALSKTRGPVQASIEVTRPNVRAVNSGLKASQQFDTRRQDGDEQLLCLEDDLHFNDNFSDHLCPKEIKDSSRKFEVYDPDGMKNNPNQSKVLKTKTKVFRNSLPHCKNNSEILFFCDTFNNSMPGSCYPAVTGEISYLRHHVSGPVNSNSKSSIRDLLDLDAVNGDFLKTGKAIRNVTFGSKQMGKEGANVFGRSSAACVAQQSSAACRHFSSHSGSGGSDFDRESSVFVLNCGSSSIKFQLLQPESEAVIIKGEARGLNLDSGAFLKWSKYDQETCKWETEKRPLSSNNKRNLRSTFSSALEEIFSVVTLVEPDYVGHRVVHGGSLFTNAESAVEVTPDMIERLSGISSLAPLHNPVQVEAIKEALLKFKIPQGVVFDTAYHATMPQRSYMYPVPLSWYTDHGVRKYGFHGISHYYVTRQLAKKIEKPVDKLNTISCHLGAGCSVTATKGGQSVDTSMGFSPLSGVMMTTRTGDIDPSLVSYLVGRHNDGNVVEGLESESQQPWKDVIQLFNTNSGLKGICGSGDSLEVEKRMEVADEMATLAIEMFCYSTAKTIASYFVPLGTVDAVIFTGGIGEKSPIKRDRILKHLVGLGLSLEPTSNENNGKYTDGLISKPGSGPLVYVIPTNEELVIAKKVNQLFANE